MPRPSLKEQRSEEILTAFARCVARFGVDGATLEVVAAEAGVSRPSVRHFVGNREDLIDALAAHVRRDYQAKMETLFAWLPQTGRIEALIEFMFAPNAASSSEDVALAQALMAAADRYPSVAAPLKGWIMEFDQRIQDELSIHAPNASPQDIAGAAFGILSLYFNIDALSQLRMPDHYGAAAKTAALNLVAHLEETSHGSD
ncbi:MAG: TetR/AcrR family transcriptional regulator [Pseudomonadota bacterium]